MLISFEETGYFGICKERVHPFQETGVENVGLVHDEADLFALAPGTSQDRSEIIVKVGGSVSVRDLDLENAQAIHPSHKPGQGSLLVSLISVVTGSLPFHHH